MSSALSSGVARIDVSKLVAKVSVIVEQPTFAPGQGGLSSTDPASYGMSRASLVLAAFQVIPLMAKNFPSIVITSLNESHPGDVITGVGGVRVEPDSGPPDAVAEGKKFFRVLIPTRSAATAKPLEAGDIRRNLLRGIVVANGALGEDVIARETAALEKTWIATYRERVPLDVVHLVWMGVLGKAWAQEHLDITGLSAAQGSANAAFAGAGRGSAVKLWWPPTPDALTFAEMQKQRAELRQVVAESKAIQAVEDREMRAKAAEQRLAAAGAQRQ
jgi:hypothetical protein